MAPRPRPPDRWEVEDLVIRIPAVDSPRSPSSRLAATLEHSTCHRLAFRRPPPASCDEAPTGRTGSDDGRVATPCSARNVLHFHPGEHPRLPVRPMLQLDRPDRAGCRLHDPEATGLDVSDRPYPQDIAQGREWTVSDLLVARMTVEPTFAGARGIRDQGWPCTGS